MGKQSLKGSKKLVKAGLVIILLASLTAAAWFLKKTKMTALTKLLARPGKYSSLWPYIKAMARYETGEFTSNAYRLENNLFGMGNAVKRPQSGRSSTKTYDGGRLIRHYAWDVGSVRDFLSYLDYVGFPTSVASVDQYVAELKRRKYFEIDEQTYLKGIKSKL